jgi:MFS family permease
MIYCNSFLPFLIVLIIAGTGFGITLIMANTLLTEQMPQRYRGKSLLFISFIAILGKFIAILSVYKY